MPPTPILGAAELTAAQAIPETTLNQIVRLLEQGALAFAVKDKDLAAPPGAPADGDAYIVAAAPTGAWSGKAKAVTFFQTGTGWRFVTPREGFRADVADEDAAYRYDGAAWSIVSAAGITGYTIDADGTLAENSDTRLPTQKAVKTYVDLRSGSYILALFFTTTPTASEVVLLTVAGAAFTLPANLAGAVLAAIGTNPAAAFALDIQRQVAGAGAFTSIATITVSTAGAVTLATAAGTAKAIAAGDGLKVIAPNPADTTAANMAFTLIGAR